MHLNPPNPTAILMLFGLLVSCKEKPADNAGRTDETLPFTQLVWSDEFDVPGKPDTGRWDYDLGDGCPNVCGWGNNELEYYTENEKNARIENGHLIIEAHKESAGDKLYTSARLVTRARGDWLYGRLEIRAKLPRGKGTWPAIWMLSTDWKYGGWPASGEIDIMEHVGYDPGVVHGTIHTEAYNHQKGTHKGEHIEVADAQDEFHDYAIEWRENSINFFVDNQQYHRVERSATDGYEEWPFDQRFHLILNLAVGGNWGGAEGVDESIWPQRLVVDYVRVYQ
jgi:beta-glucanase (GH16 family)